MKTDLMPGWRLRQEQGRQVWVVVQYDLLLAARIIEVTHLELHELVHGQEFLPAIHYPHSPFPLLPDLCQDVDSEKPVELSAS